MQLAQSDFFPSKNKTSKMAQNPTKTLATRPHLSARRRRLLCPSAQGRIWAPGPQGPGPGRGFFLAITYPYF
jgi:hypothetical protein